MIGQPDIFGLDFPSLAQQICDPALHGKHNLYINELLFDVREWSPLGTEKIVHRLANNPLAVVAAWELASAGGAIAQESQAQTAFLQQFCDWEIIQKMVYLGLNPLPDPLPGISRAIHRYRQGRFSSLVFLQDVLRWAQRFAHFSPYDIRDFTRINLQFPFAVALVEEELQGEELLIIEVLQNLGIKILKRDPQVAAHHLQSWLVQTLGLEDKKSAVQQIKLDFREAGGTRNSVYVVRAVGGVDGYDVRGTIGPDLGLIIDIGDKEVSMASTAYIEKHVIRVINNNTSLSAELANGSLRLKWYDDRLTAEDLGQQIHRALKEEFILGIISVKMIFDSLRLSSIKPQIYSYVDERKKLLQQRVEEQEPLVVCTECQSYFPHAFCLASAERSPCCGRSYDELATVAQFTRNPRQVLLDRGVCQDRLRGAYIGAKKAASIFSEGNVESLNLHSLRDNPHPTTAIPQCIAYYRSDLDIICIISHDFKGRSPDGKTFDSLLQRVAGLQTPGFAGISEEYILSPRFFSGEGGFARIGWMNESLKSRLEITAEHIATEKDCTNLGGLKDFLATWRR